MKKKFKILSIIVIIILILVGGVWGSINTKQDMEDSERRNTMTLMEYIKTHESPVLYLSLIHI